MSDSMFGWVEFARANVQRIQWSIALVFFAVGVMPLVPPRPTSQKSDPAGFSVDRAMSHVGVIAQAPHPVGSTENARVRGYLVNTLSEMGLPPETQLVEVPDYFEESGRTVEVVNVMARIEGADPTGALALVAHYDTVPTTPGANDDSGAVGTLLEIAKILVSDPPMVNDVILLFTDGEEPAPRFGSSAFVAEHPWFDDVDFVVNLEASGSAGPSLLIETSGSERWVIDQLVEATPHPAAFSFVTEISELIGGIGTDFTPFKEGNVPGLSFAYFHGSPIYHTDSDSVANVGLASLQQQGANALSLARSLGSTDLDVAVNSEGAVFFTVAGSHILRYSDVFARAVALVAVVVLGVAVVRNRRRGHLSVGRLLLGVAFVSSVFVATVVMGGLLWALLAGWRRTPGVGEAYAYLLLLLLAVFGIWSIAVRLARRKLDGPHVLGGVVVIWVVLAVVTSALAPGISYLFAWPALLGSVHWTANPAKRGSVVWALLSVLAVTAVVLILSIPAIDFFYQMAQPRPGNPDSELVSVAGAATGLGILVVALIQSVTATK